MCKSRHKMRNAKNRLAIRFRWQNETEFRPFFRWGKGVKKERPGTDHVISGPMRGIKQLHPMAQTDRQRDKHGNSVTNRLY